MQGYGRWHSTHLFQFLSNPLEHQKNFNIVGWVSMAFLMQYTENSSYGLKIFSSFRNYLCRLSFLGDQPEETTPVRLKALCLFCITWLQIGKAWTTEWRCRSGPEKHVLRCSWVSDLGKPSQVSGPKTGGVGGPSLPYHPLTTRRHLFQVPAITTFLHSSINASLDIPIISFHTCCKRKVAHDHWVHSTSLLP